MTGPRNRSRSYAKLAMPNLSPENLFPKQEPATDPAPSSIGQIVVAQATEAKTDSNPQGPASEPKGRFLPSGDEVKELFGGFGIELYPGKTWMISIPEGKTKDEVVKAIRGKEFEEVVTDSFVYITPKFEGTK